jgi:uncharacterized membrane protein
MSNPYVPGSPVAPAPGGMHPAEQEIQNKATHAIIAAVIGFFCCFLVDIYAIMVANQALAMIDQTGAGQQHRTLATAAKIIAIIHLVLAGLGILLWIVMMVLGVAAGVANQ